MIFGMLPLRNNANQNHTGYDVIIASISLYEMIRLPRWPYIRYSNIALRTINVETGSKATLRAGVYIHHWFPVCGWWCTRDWYLCFSVVFLFMSRWMTCMRSAYSYHSINWHLSKRCTFLSIKAASLHMRTGFTRHGVHWQSCVSIPFIGFRLQLQVPEP